MRYRELEIERGGKIVGALEQLEAEAASFPGFDSEGKASEPVEGKS